MSVRSNQFDLGGPDNVVFGSGTVEQVGERAAALGESALVVTDPGIDDAGLLEPVGDSLAAAGVDATVFDGVEPDPSLSTVLACADAAKTADSDVLVGVGGGSSMDVAKGAATLLTNDATPRELFGRGNVPNQSAPTILVPTTAGTGSEVSQALVVFDDANEKKGIVDDAVFAHTALVDPDLTMDLPVEITRTTGLDAFTHALGSYVSTGANPFADALCADAMERIEANLREAVYYGADAPEAREEMAAAATMAMIGRVNGGKSAVHSFAYGVQKMYDVPHGEAIALVLPEVVEYNLPAAVEPLARLGRRLYDAGGGAREQAAATVEGISRLRADVGLDRGLRSVGADEGDLDRLSELAVHSERHLEANPRPLTREDAAGILRSAL